MSLSSYEAIVMEMRTGALHQSAALNLLHKLPKSGGINQKCYLDSRTRPMHHRAQHKTASGNCLLNLIICTVIMIIVLFQIRGMET